MSQVEIGQFDETDTGYQFFAGYRFKEDGLPLEGTLGVEAGYVDFGSPDERVAGDQAEVDIDAFKVYVTANRSIGERWSILGKLGIVSWDESRRVMGLSRSNDDTDLAVGIGAEWRKDNQPFSVRGEIEGFDFLDGVWLWSVSAVYRFGGNR